MYSKLEVGCGKADITPKIGTTLSGFIFRENKPSVSIDSPLSVYVLAFRWNLKIYYLISYELLSISTQLQENLQNALIQGLGDTFSKERCVMLATHTHSAPPINPLEGEIDADTQYWQLLYDKTVQAARDAVNQMTPATLHIASVRIPGITYNRRAILANGRVSMAINPEEPVISRGPVDDTLTLLTWQDEIGNCISSIIHFACHGAAVNTQAIGGDIPGELSRHIEEILGAPCIFLQGATGDVNPTVISSNRAEMLVWSDRVIPYLNDLTKKLHPISSAPFQISSIDFPLFFQPIPDKFVIKENIKFLDQIGKGDIDSPSVQQTLKLLADIMNFKPGERPDLGKVVFCANALANAERRRLAAVETGQPLPSYPLRISIWIIGQIGFVFVAAELFTITGLKIRAMGKNFSLLPVGYAAPIVGYIPDQNSMKLGGYEVNDAWRFYRQLAPFAADTEERLVKRIEDLVNLIESTY